MAAGVPAEQNSCCSSSNSESSSSSSNSASGQSSGEKLNGREIRGVMFGAAVAGFCCRCLLHPIDTVKAMMQAQTSTNSDSCRSPPQLLLQRGSYGRSVLGETTAARTTASAALAVRGGSGVGSVRYTQLLPSTLQALSTVWKNEGIRGLYRGFCVCGLGSIPATCMYFTSYYLVAGVANDAAVHLRVLASTSSKGDRSSSPSASGHSTAASSSALLPSAAEDEQQGRQREEQQKRRPQDQQQQRQKTSAAADLLAGFAAEAISCVLWVPIDVCKERLQTQRVLGVYSYRGSLDCMRQMCGRDGKGIRELYKGYAATLLAFGPLSALFFMFDNQLKTAVQCLYTLGSTSSSSSTDAVLQTAAGLRPLPAWAAGGCAMVAAAAAAWITAPLDKVKLRIQVQRAAGRSGGERQGTVCAQTPYNYRNVSEGLKEMYMKEGIKGLFRASGARVAFHSGSFALQIMLLEYFKDIYLRYVESLPGSARSLA